MAEERYDKSRAPRGLTLPDLVWHLIWMALSWRATLIAWLAGDD